MNSRHPGEGSDHIHGGPQVGPGTTAGGSTAGPQPVAHEAPKAEGTPGHTATTPAPVLDHAGEAKPEVQHDEATSGAQKGTGSHTGESAAPSPAKH